MTAAILGRSDRSLDEQGLRPVDARRDMASVADLIERSFERELDGKSRRMVRDMRTFGRAGWFGWLVGHLFLPPAAFPLGFVWQETKGIVGNASLLPIYEGASRWVLANVAVHPEHRRQGIARRLVEACLELAREQNASEVLLQVRSDNEGALDLYRSLHFDILTERTKWVCAATRSLEEEDDVLVRDRRPEEWSQQWELAQSLFPEGLYWPYPLRRSWFEQAGWQRLLPPNREHHWVVADAQGQLRASLTARFSHDSEGWRLALLVPPTERGVLEGPLLRRAAKDLRHTGLPLAVSYPPGSADEDLLALGFRRRRTLTWMGIEV